MKMAEFANRFKHPFLRRAFPHLQYDIPGTEVPMIAPLLFMGGLHDGDLGWPVGGSLAFSKRLEKRLESLDGKVTYKAEVEKILTADSKAVGVRLADGTEHRADRIISAADGRATIYDWLEGKFLTDAIRRYYDDPFETGPFGFIVNLGLNMSQEGVPHARTLLFDDPLDVGDVEQDSLYVTTYDSKTGLVPRGKSIVKVEVQAHYPRWKNLRDRDAAAYRAEKEKVATRIIDRLAPSLPGLEDAIEVTDISTLVTAERYTGNYHGAQAGPPREDVAEIQRFGLSRTLPGLDRFHMVSQWASAQLGVSSVAVQARNLVRELCQIDGRRFRLP